MAEGSFEALWSDFARFIGRISDPSSVNSLIDDARDNEIDPPSSLSPGYGSVSSVASAKKSSSNTIWVFPARCVSSDGDAFGSFILREFSETRDVSPPLALTV